MRQLTTSAVVDVIDRSPICSWQIRTFVLCFLISAYNGFDTQSIAFVAPTLSKLWGVGRSDFGLVFSAALLGTLIGSLALAPLGDRFGRKPVILLSTLLFATGSLASILATDLPELALYRGLTGIGLGAGLPPVIALAYEYSPRRKRSLITTCIALGFTAGGMTGAALSAAILPVYGWKSVFAIGGVLPLVTLVPIGSMLPESIRALATRTGRSRDLSTSLGRIDPSGDYRLVEFLPATEGGRRRAPLRTLFSDGRAAGTCLLWLAFAANLFMINFMINWLPSVLHDAGVPLTKAITAITVFDLGGIIAGLACAWVIDRSRSYAALPITYLLTAVAIAAVGATSHHIVPLFIALFFSGAGVIGAFSGMNVLAGAVYPTSARTTGVAWAFGVGHVGSILGPASGGLIVALGWSVQQIFLFGAAPALVAAAGIGGIIAIGAIATHADHPSQTAEAARPTGR